MKALGGPLLGVVLGLLVLAAVAPSLIALSSALLPVVIAVAIALIACRLVFFHTRRW